MATGNQEFAVGNKSIQEAIESTLLGRALFSFAPCFVVFYFFSSCTIVGPSFSRLFFSPSGKVSENTAAKSST